MLDTLRIAAKYHLKYMLSPLLFRFPPTDLQPERLQRWLRAVIETAAVPGGILEIGCHLCGTTAITHQMMRNLAIKKPYLCVDTFGGFVPSQFNDDLHLGNVPGNRHVFSANSMKLARRVLEQHGASAVELVQGDIVTIPDSMLPTEISLALIDVDLAIPVYEGLKKVYPRLTPRGAIFVDDCPENYGWQARKGYEKFCIESGIRPVYEFGMGVIAA